MRLTRSLLVLALCSLVSCVFSRNSHPVIGKSIDKPLQTCRPAVLVDGETWTGVDVYLGPRKQMAQLVDAADPAHRRKGKWKSVPVGTGLVVNDIKLFKGDGHTNLTAFGTLDHKGRKIPFYYDLGYWGILNRAVWEDEQIPARRDFDIFYEKEETQQGGGTPAAR